MRSDQGLKVLQPTNLKDESFLKTLKDLECQFTNSSRI